MALEILLIETLVLIILGITSLIFGIKFLIKYRVTKNKMDLILGLVLTFIIPGILIYIGTRNLIRPMIVYGPGPM